MALDAIPTYPSEYDGTGTTNNPPGSDSRRQGDDQLRILKANLQQALPNVSGQVTASHEELNTLAGIDTGQTIESRLDALEAGALPGGGVTVLAYWQTAAPPGWTQITSQGVSDYMLRVVTNAGGGSGGSDSPILNDKVPSHTHPWSTTGGPHTHGIQRTLGGSPTNRFIEYSALGFNQAAALYNNPPGDNVLTTDSHSHSGTTSANSGASNWTPKYVDMILASKD